MNYQRQILNLRPLDQNQLSNFKDINQLIDYHFQIFLRIYKPRHKIYQIFDQNQSNSKRLLYRRIYYTSPDENHPLVCQYYVSDPNSPANYQIYVIDTIILDRNDFQLINFKKFVDQLESHYLSGLLASLEANLHIRKFKTFNDPRYRLDECSKIRNCFYRLKNIDYQMINQFKASYQTKALQHLKEYWYLAEHQPIQAQKKIKELESFFRFKNDTDHLKVIIIFFQIKKLIEKLI
jgi:hypothetical protein